MPGPQPTLTIEEVDAVRRRVLNVVGHELRTPVSAIAGLSRQLAAASHQDIRAELGPAIERLASRTERLLDDLLLAAGITTALPVEAPARLDLPSAVAATWNELGPVTTGRSLRIHGGGVRAVVGEITVHRMLSHVLRNAATYGQGEVGVTTEQHGDLARVQVESRGSVPTANELPLVFEPFFRGEHAVTAGAGLGLGLSVARALARHAGGDVTFDVLDDGRTVTTIELPAAETSS